MNEFYDTLILLTLKLGVMIGFIFLIKLWIKKTKNIAPIIIYAVLGIFFVLMMSQHIFEYFLTILFFNGNNIEMIKTTGVILGLIFYILVYQKYLKKYRKK
jgi:hypothetical protein